SGLGTTSAFTSFSINSAKVGNTALAVTVTVISSAQTGQLNFISTATYLKGPATISVAGSKGTVQLSFASSTKVSAVTASINQFTDSTGVTALASSTNTAIKLTSTTYGANQFVSVTSNNTNAFSTRNRAGVATNSNFGSNAALTVNGTTGTSDGLNVKAVFGDLLDVSFTLNSTANVAGTTKTFGITGGGATFSLGAQVNSSTAASIGIGNVNTASLGKYVSNGSVLTLSDLAAGKSAAVNTGDTNLAQAIVNQAVKDVAVLRGRLGAFQKNVLGSTINSLNVALENVASSNSAIRDTDFASETANLTRSQILSQSSTTVLQQANQSPQSVLKLLG
ncbi:MAG: flagellin, partial [Phycisphaerae bacterium]